MRQILLPQEIFTHDVELNIYYGAQIYALKIGMFKCVGYNSNRKGIPGNIKDGEADPIDTDGAFFNY